MKLKKIIAFALCVVLSFPLFACGKDAGEIDPGSDPSIGGTGDNTNNGGTGDNGGTGNNGGNNGGNTDLTQCTITFDVGDQARAAGVTVTPASITVKSGTTLGSQYPTPSTYTGYTFMGWYNGATKVNADTVIKGSYTVTADWLSDADAAAAAEYEAKIDDWSQNGHLYIHYKRYDHKENEATTAGTPTNTGAPGYSTQITSDVYHDWGLWLWPKNDNGRLFNAAWIDNSGAVYDVLLDNNYNDAGWDGTRKVPLTETVNFTTSQNKPVTTIGMQLFQISTRTGTGFWANDGGNNDLVIEQITRTVGNKKYAHWFVSQGRVGSGSARYSAKEVVDPYKDIAPGSATTKATVGDGIINSSATSLYEIVPNKAAGYENAGVGYQIFIASFADSDGDGMGDLRGIINHLDYLESLNVDVLWLTPFQSSTNYHGYDIKDYYSVDSRFGTLADYRELVYKVHKKGMKIVMDFVLNHTAQSNPWFVKSQNLEKEGDINYRNFYTWINETQYNGLTASEKTQWYKDAYGYYFYSSFSSDMPELNYDYQPVRDAILDVCNYWMAFGLDGFRLDAVKHIYMKNEVKAVGKTPSTGSIDNGEGCVEDGLYSYDMKRNINFYREFNYRLKAAYPNAFLVGENLDGNPRNVSPFYQGIDSQFNFNLYYDAGRAFAAAFQSDLNCGYGNAAVSKYIEGYYGNSYTAQGTGERVNVKGYATTNPNFIDGLFTSNHDLPRARDRMNITTNSTAQVDTYHTLGAAQADKTDKLLRMYYAYIMTMPGLNWIYYGDEIGMTGVMQSTINSGSTSTTESQPHEDRVYRQPMKWYNDMSKNASYDIGYSDLKAELVGLNATDSVKGVYDDQNPNNGQDKDQGSLLNWMRTLTKVRHNNPVLINGHIETKTEGGKQTNKYQMSGSTMIYGITNGSQTVKVYLNVGEYEYSQVSGTVLASYNYSNGKLGKYGIVIAK